MALTPDRYNAALRARERLCRACDEWRPIASFPRYQNPGQGYRRRRRCVECRNEQAVYWNRGSRARVSVG